MPKALNMSLAVTADTTKARQQLMELQSTLQQISTSSAKIHVGVNTADIQSASKAALELSAHLKEATNLKTGTLDFTKLNNSIRNSGKTLEQYGQQLVAMGPQGRQAFTQLATSVAQSEIPIKRISGMLGQMGTVLGNTIRWQAASSIIHGIMGTVQQAFGYAKQLNASLNRIQLVTQMSDTQMSKFAESANKAAKALSITTTAYTDAALIYYQQGIRNQDEINKRATATAKMANVTGQSAQKVSDQMTAIWNNFAKGGDNLEYYADVITALGAATASSSEEISRGLEKFAAIADTVGLSYENATAALATITATTRQSADSVGTGLRTLFSRLQSVSLGETLEDGVNLTKYSKALEKVGVQVLDTSGELRSMDDILMDLGDKWDKISDSQKVALAQTVGGVRQYTTLMALMDNFDFYKENVGIATNSAGTLNKQQEIFEQSWGAAAQRVKASMESIFSNLINDKFFTNLTSGFAKFLDIINNMITGFGGVKGMLLSIGGTMTRVFNQQVTKGVYNFANGIRNMFRTPTQQAAERERFLNRATSIYAGLGPNQIPVNADGSLNLKGLSLQQSQMAISFRNQVANQTLFAANSPYMNDIQRMTALFAMDNAKRAQEEFNTAQNARVNSLQRIQGIQSRTGGIQNQSLMGSIQNYRNNVTASTILNDKINKLMTGELTPEQLGRGLVATLTGGKISDYDNNLKTLKSTIKSGDRTTLTNNYLQNNRFKGESLVQQRDKIIEDLKATPGWNEDTAKEYVDLLTQERQQSLSEKDAKRLAELRQKDADSALTDMSKGMKISQGAVNLAGGLMSGVAASQGLQSGVGAIEQYKAGVIDAGQAATQAAAGFAQMGFQGVQSALQLSKVMGPVAGTITAIGLTALPYIVKGIDSLVTTPKEVLESLHKSTEQAESLATEAAAAYDTLLSKFDTHNSLLDQLDNLKRGTLEFEQALLKANDAAYQLIHENNLSDNQWYIDDNGAVQIKKEAQQQLQEQALNKQRETQAEAYMAKSIEETAKTFYQNDEVQKIYQDIVNQPIENAEKYYKQQTSGNQITVAGRKRYEDFTNNGQLTREEAQNKLKTEGGTDINSKTLDFYYDVLAERDRLASLQNYDLSELESYYEKHKNEMYGIDKETFLQEVQNNTFGSNMLVRSGAASQNRTALSNAILAKSGEEKLSDVDSLIVDALSKDVAFQERTQEAGAILQGVERNKTWWERLGDAFTIQGSGGLSNIYLAGSLSGDMSTYNRLTSNTVTDNVDLRQELDKLSTEELKKQYKELGATDAEIKAFEESSTYKAAINEGTDAQREAWKQLILRKRTLDEQVKEEQKIKNTLQKLDSGKVWKDLNNYTKLSGEEFNNMIIEAGKALKDIDDEAVRKSAEGIIDAAKNYKAKTNAEFLKAARAAGIDQIGTLSNSLEDISIEVVGKMNQVNQNFFEQFGKEARNWTTNKMVKTNGTLDKEVINALENFEFADSKIQTLLNIKQGKTSLSNIKGLAEEGFDALKAAAGGESGLLEELYNSEGFEDNLKALQKELKKTGKIGAKSIMDMGEQLGIVNDMLEVSGASAQALADVFTNIELGDLNIEQITDDLIAALTLAGQVKDNLTSSFSFIDTFQQERSSQDIGKFTSGLVKSIDSAFESGQFFDPQALQAWGTLLGNESLAEYRRFFTDATREHQTPEEIQEAFNKQFEAENIALDSIKNNGNLTGLWEYYDKQPLETGKSAMFTWNEKTGQVDITDEQLANYESQEDFIKGLQDTYGISENMAKMMAAELGAAAPALNKQWNETAAQRGAQRLFQEERINEKTGEYYLDQNGEHKLFDRSFVTAAEVETYLNSSADILKSTDRAGLASILSPLLGQGQDINNILDSMGITGDNLLNLDINKLAQQIISGNIYGQGGNILDLDDEFFQKFDSAKLKDKLGNKYSEVLGIENAGYYAEDNLGPPVAHYIADLEDLEKGLTSIGDSSEMATQHIQDMVDAGDLTDVNIEVADLEKGTKTLSLTSVEVMRAWKEAGNEGKVSVQFLKDYAEEQNKIQEENIAIAQAAKPITQGIMDAFTALQSEEYQEQLKNVFQGFDNITLTPKYNFEDVHTEIASLAQEMEALSEIPIQRDIIYTIKYQNKNGEETDSEGNVIHPASGYNNGNGTGFAGGKHVNGQYTGLAEVGELGPELWIHDGQPYLAGVHGRTKAYIHASDQIYTATQTREILNNNPSLQDIPGFYVGYKGWKRGGGASGTNVKEADFDPERYHLITRMLKDVQREYERLAKIKENAYATNKLEAIQREVELTKDLIEGQKELIKQTEDYLKIDAGRLKGMLEKDEFQVDENGNLINYDELQDKYKRMIDTKKDANGKDLDKDELERLTNIWKALSQYEETVDKLNEANVEMQDLLYQEMELRLEKITTKVDMRIDFDDREIKLLDHYIERIDDNIYHTAEVLALTEQKLGHINQKIEDTKVGITELFEELSDSEGNLIRKDDSSAYTLEEWLAMSEEQRDLLDINDNFGKQLEQYTDDILSYIEELEEFKTKGVEEFGEAFDELNDNVRSSIDLFDHYNKLLSSLKNITQLQGVKLSAEMKAAMREIDAAMFNNTQNNIDAERENYRRLSANVADLRKKINETTDETLKKAWEEQLKTAEEELRTSEQNLLSLWETGLQQAKDMFETALQDAVDEYESTIAGMYGNMDELQKAWDLKKSIDDIYVKDYEKYYQISKLQRSITRDLENAAKSGNKQNKGLKTLYDELNEKRASGVQLSEYDLDIFAKRYEYEKALMELEDARNNKSEVRLQRDANGNWGYVYTSSADEDELAAKQQKVDDTLYEWQKATQEGQNKMIEDTMSAIQGIGKELQELYGDEEADPEVIKQRLENYKQQLAAYKQQLQNALRDAGMTEDIARERYGEAAFDIINSFDETLFSDLMNTDDIDAFFAKVMEAMEKADSTMGTAAGEYQSSMDAINKWFNESGEDLAKVIKGFAAVIDSESEGNLIDSKEQIQNAKDTFDEILKVATEFEKEFMKIYQPIIDENEKLVADLLYALHALNREEYEGPGHEGYHYDFGSFDELPSLEEEDTGGGGDTKPIPCQHKHTRWYDVGHGEIQEYCLDCKKWLGHPIQGGTGRSEPGPGGGGGRPWVMVKLASGGYTGEWGTEGRMAMLHEKELVLNKDDTQKFLDATNILRTIDLQTNLFSKGFGDMIVPWIDDLKSQPLDQNVHIDASFPNVTDRNEIEAAFDNLINKATQYANRKNMSSMTFQDMYTSKF